MSLLPPSPSLARLQQNALDTIANALSRWSFGLKYRTGMNAFCPVGEGYLPRDKLIHDLSESCRAYPDSGQAGISSFQQFWRRYIKRLCDPYQNHQAWIATTTLDASNVGEVNFCFEGKFFLCHFLLKPKLPSGPMIHESRPGQSVILRKACSIETSLR